MKNLLNYYWGKIVNKSPKWLLDLFGIERYQFVGRLQPHPGQSLFLVDKEKKSITRIHPIPKRVALNNPNEVYVCAVNTTNVFKVLARDHKIKADWSWVKNEK